jgi:hypothetical protein
MMKKKKKEHNDVPLLFLGLHNNLILHVIV